MNAPRKIAIALAAAVASGSSWADNAHPPMDTLDFESLGVGDLGTTTASLPDATIVSAGSSLFQLSQFYFGGQGGAICALTSSFTCAADLTINFTTAVTGLTFQTVGYDPGDKVKIYAYDGSTLVAVRTVTSDKTVSFAHVGPITSLFFDDRNSTGAGFGYGMFCFTPQVPEPASIAMLLAGLGILGVKARRRNDSA